MNYFLSLPVAPLVREELKRVCHGLRRMAPNARWSPPLRYHITLRYFGPIASTDRDRLLEWLSSWVLTCPKIEFRVRGLDVFGTDIPRVLYASIEGSLAPLQDWLHRLNQDLDAEFGPALAPESRGWVPHITLARARTREGDSALLRAAKSIKCEIHPQILDELLFLGSDPTRTDGGYLQIRKFAL